MVIVPSSLWSGWRPPSRSMIERRRWPRPTAPSIARPAPSGPRCAMTSRIAAISLGDTGRPSVLNRPQMPHMLARPSRRADLHQAAIDRLEIVHAAVIIRARLDQAPGGRADPAAAPSVTQQLEHRLGDAMRVSHRNDHAVAVA